MCVSVLLCMAWGFAYGLVPAMYCDFNIRMWGWIPMHDFGTRSLLVWCNPLTKSRSARPLSWFFACAVSITVPNSEQVAAAVLYS